MKAMVMARRAQYSVRPINYNWVSFLKAFTCCFLDDLEALFVKASMIKIMMKLNKFQGRNNLCLLLSLTFSGHFWTGSRVVDIFIVFGAFFSGNSSMLFQLTVMCLCFFFLNLGSNFLVENSAFLQSFFFWDMDQRKKRMFLGSFLFLLERRKETLSRLSFLKVEQICHILSLPHFFAKPKKWVWKLFFSRFFNLASFLF